MGAACVGVGGQRQLAKGSFFGLYAEYLYGGTLRTDLQAKPVAIGGRGNLVGSYSADTLFFGGYYNWSF